MKTDHLLLAYIISYLVFGFTGAGLLTWNFALDILVNWIGLMALTYCARGFLSTFKTNDEH